MPREQRVEKLTKVLGLTAPPKFGPDDAVKIQNEIRSQLMKAGKPAYVEETFVSFEQAYQLILELGGIPCYPTLVDGTSPICPFEDPVEKMIDNVKSRNFHCAEFIAIRNSPEKLSEYVIAVRRAGLVITAGTEHNTLDLLPIEPTAAGGKPIPPAVQEIFWEGAASWRAISSWCSMEKSVSLMRREIRIRRTRMTKTASPLSRRSALR